MLTIEHCENITIQLAGGAEAIGPIEHIVLRAPTVQTSATPPLGELWPGQGGRYAGTMPARDGKPGYHLILANETKERVTWGPYNHTAAGADDHRDGLANTLAIMEASSSDKAFPAAQWADSLEVDELNDFYLPSHNELMLMWICVPQLFAKGYHWSSTQYSPYGAWVQDFEYGYSGIYGKGNEIRAVAVRRLVL